MNGLGIRKYDREGRVIMLEYYQFVLFNLYIPNGRQSPARLRYKMEFSALILDYLCDLITKGKHIVACGDFNTAHKEIDLARPKQNQKRSGFLPDECAWIDKFLSNGFADTFRHLNDGPDSTGRDHSENPSMKRWTGLGISSS